jgi:hypothetical protein
MGVAGFVGRIFRRIRLPVKLAFQLTKGAQVLAHPVNYRRRVRGAKTMTENSRWSTFITRRKGYALFDLETFPGTDTVVSICRQVYARYMEQDRNRDGVLRKTFLVNILNAATLEENPQLLDFALSDPIVEAVTGYLGSIPILRGLGVYLSQSNDTTESSQMFHTDNDDFRQIKCFMNVVDVDDGNGPFTLVPAKQSRQIRSTLRHGWRDRRLTDDEVLALCDPADIIRLTGPAGSGGMVDTSNCLHYGSRARAGARVVFMFQYTTYPNVAFDNSAYSGKEGLPLYHFPMHRVTCDPWRQALLGPHIGRAIARPTATSRH